VWSVVARFRNPESALAARTWLDQLDISQPGSYTEGIDSRGVTLAALIRLSDMRVVMDTVARYGGRLLSSCAAE
jgi:hypothetical protein